LLSFGLSVAKVAASVSGLSFVPIPSELTATIEELKAMGEILTESGANVMAFAEGFREASETMNEVGMLLLTMVCD
jgi:hypothetical protein